ncbi:MAG TPA: hypothetical protein VGC41_27905, partial [Kofleriaceae bacterium]
MIELVREPQSSPRPTDTLLALREIAVEVARIDLGAADASTEVLAGTSRLLGEILERAIAHLLSLQTLETDESAVLAMDLDALEPDAWSPRVPVPTTPRVDDVCFAGSLELRRAQRELATATTDSDRLVAAELACRKLRRAMRAVLEAAREAGMIEPRGDEQPDPYQIPDLASGLAVRRLYAGFRRSLRSSTSRDPEAVLTAVRYAVGALAMLVSAPDYAHVRASDRAILRELRERALRWARGDRAIAAGLNFLEDVRTCGDLLRGINRRQEIRTHDVALVRQLANGDHGRLSDLYGLDDVIDDLILRAATEPVHDAILTRLTQMQM